MQKWTLRALVGAVVFLTSTAGTYAQETFDDGGADSNWTTDLNWLDDTAPNPAATGGLIFNLTTTATADVAHDGITSIEATANSPTLDGMTLSFTGGASITNNGAGTLTIENDLFITDTSLTINAASGNIIIDNAGAGSIDTNGNTLILDGANSISLGHVISGAGGLTKNGAGTSTLTNANTFTGPVQVNAGELQLDGGSAFADTVAVTIAGGGTVQITADETIGSLAGSGSFDLQNSQLTVGDATDTTFSGILSGAGAGSLVKQGTGTFTLSGANTFAGPVQVNDGTLELSGGSALADTVAVNVGMNGTTRITADETIGSLAGSGSFDLQNSQLTVGDATDTTFSGVLSGAGAGSLVKQGAGTFTLSGTNTFTGPLQINDGTLGLSGGSALADTVAVTVAGGGTLALNANETIGSLTGTGMVDLGASQLTAGDANDTTYSGVMSGTGAFVKQGTGTFTLSGANTYTGPTTINAGTLALTGSVAGNVVNSAMLMGDGSIGGDLNNAGTLSPGNSIGTINVAGNYTQDAGADLAVEISKDGGGTITNDQVNVTGTATLANNASITLTDLGGGGTFATGDTLTVITTGGGVTDNGVVVNDSLMFLVFNPMVNGNNLDLVAAAAATFSSAATGENNIAIASALDADAASSTGDFNTFVTAMAALGGGAPLNDALQQSGPFAYSAVTDASLRLTQRHAEVNANYLRGRRSGSATMAQVAANNDSLLTLTPTASNPMLLASTMDQMAFETAADNDQAGSNSAQPANAPQQNAETQKQERQHGLMDNLNVYGTVFGLFNDQDDRNDYAGFQTDTVGAQFGVDTELTDELLVGLMVGLGHTQIDLDNGGEGDADSIRIGPYATWTPIKRMYVDASLTYGYHMNDLDRNVSFAGFSGTPTGDYNAHDLSAYLGTGYDIPYEQFTLTPFASLQYTWQHTESFTETSGGGAALQVNNRDTHSLRSRVGGRVSTVWDVGDLRLAPEAFVAWGHEFLNNDDIDANFAGGSTTFTIDPSESSDDSVYFGAGLSALISDGISAFVRYEGEHSGDGTVHGIGGGLTMMF